MAGKVVGSAFSGFFGSRAYAAQAAAATAAKNSTEGISLPKQDAKTTTLPNGLIVASVENYSPITRVGIVVKAGARYETSPTLGAAHAIRNAAGGSTKKASSFGITKNLELNGSNLCASATRENILYELQCNRDNVGDGLTYLTQVATQTNFHPWELSLLKTRMTYELADLKMNPTAVLLEALHKAAYRGGLSNSLYSPKFMVGKHSQNLIQSHIAQTYNPNRTAVVGLGIDHALLLDYVNKFLILEEEGNATGASKYQGGEFFINQNGPLAYAAIVAEGAGLKNAKDALSLGLLSQILGVGPRVHYSEGTNSKLGQAAAKATSSPFAVSSINLNYSDTGLFGFFVAGAPKDMGQIVKSVVGKMREVGKASPSAQDLSAAKQRLKAAINIAAESQTTSLGDISEQLLATGELKTATDLSRAIDALTAQDVVAASAKVIKGKPTMAAYGPLQNVPHLEEL